jgi:AcrR family transcriptional regulator
MATAPKSKPSTPKSKPSPPEPSRGPRRLSREARRTQLVEAAIPVMVEDGLSTFALEDVAARADVTRNLLYHYFPRGRSDLVIAVAEHVGEELTEGWVTDESVPLVERMAANAARFLKHAMTPTDAWVLYRRARALDDPELNVVIARYEDVLVANISFNQLGTREPTWSVRLALKGYLAFIETVLGEARATGTPVERVVQLLGQGLLAVVEVARKVSDEDE